MRIIDGKSHSSEIYKSLKSFVDSTISPYGKEFEPLNNIVRPTLAFFLIGEREDSKIYVNIKKKRHVKELDLNTKNLITALMLLLKIYKTKLSNVIWTQIFMGF